MFFLFPNIEDTVIIFNLQIRIEREREREREFHYRGIMLFSLVSVRSPDSALTIWRFLNIVCDTIEVSVYFEFWPSRLQLNFDFNILLTIRN